MATVTGINPSEIQRVYAAVDYFMELEAQDRSMVVEMSQEMLNDLIEAGQLKPMIIYVRRYCDCADSPEEIAEIAANI
jgi:hypothetical protein